MCKAKHGLTAQLQGVKTKQQSLGFAINTSRREKVKMPRCRKASPSIENSDTRRISCVGLAGRRTCPAAGPD